MPAHLGSVNIATMIHTGEWTGSMGATGIDKRPVERRVTATRTGLTGDRIVDLDHHGGIDRAVYAYAREDAAWWERDLSRELPPGSFGENLSTCEISLTEALIGERWAVGAAQLEVSAPRIPCRVFAGFWKVTDLVKRFTAHAAPGAYLRVLQEGEIGVGDRIDVVHRPSHGVRIGEVFRALTTEPWLLRRLLEAPELPDEIRARALRRTAIGARESLG